MTWQHVAWVESESQPGKEHEIKRHPSTGALACGCTAYRFARGEKTCKHLRAFNAGEQMDAVRAVKPAVRHERVSVVSAGERFTVRRRAISLEVL